MAKTKVDWEATKPNANSVEGVKTTSDVSIQTSVNCFSDLDQHGNTVQFYSWQYATSSMPYMSVWSYLYYDPTKPVGDSTTLKKASFESDTNCMYLSTDEEDYENAPTGYYRTTGVHYMEFPAGTNPPSASATSYSGFGDWAYHEKE
ncbi:hypothetical protein [Syntrophomonas zehnderi]|uniref:hypothetical protein n=1 Tax=Syntrophomonas zehnderi TaxID=404335 RepID=UPI000A8F888F|nr:hypothetical protein [Syntrophomonas zehnderi]